MSKGLLFAEPSIAETGIWCKLNDGIDPAEWASLCRFIGNLSPRKFEVVRKKIMPMHGGLGSREIVGIPLVSLGPSGISGEYQREV